MRRDIGFAANCAARLRAAGGLGCVDASRRRPYREALRLGDGREVMLRPLHRSDAAALRGFFLEGLSPRMRLLRFHGAINHFSEGRLLAMSTQTPGHQVALTAVARTDDGLERLLADARYVVDEDDRAAAEFAIAVADDWQGQGIGRALLQRLAAHAAHAGLALLRGSVVPDNERMLRLMDSVGASVHGHAPEVTVHLRLREA